MAVVLCYMDMKGYVIERFLNLVHVSDTSALSFKESLESLLAKHGLSLLRIRGQGYDGASNMRGEFNGLKSLILKENQCVFYVHCVAHQLQLALVAIAKDQIQIASFFNLVASLKNVVGASCKCCDILREKQLNKVVEALKKCEISSGHGLNQELGLKRAVDTHWGSHYCTLLNLIAKFSSIIEVFEIIKNHGINSGQKAKTCALSNLAQIFKFAFCLHLMKTILGITNEISNALQRKDQDIINAMALVGVSKQQLQKMRENGWDLLLGEFSIFCDKHSLVVPKMNDPFVVQGRSCRKAAQVSNLHHFQVELFYQVINMQLQELNNIFIEMSIELLLCVACLSPRDSFVRFNMEKLVQLAQFYPFEFSEIELMALNNQLESYIVGVRLDNRFSDLNGMGDISKKLVETRKHIVYLLVYLLLKLALILSVETAMVERTFSAMNFIKNRLRNRMDDDLLNDCLVTFFENDVSDNVKNEDIIKHFQNMKTRREHV